jgi:predicted transcriptional regulator of viral defense system
MRSAREFIDDLAARGRYHFSTEEAQRALGGSLPAVRASLRRLKRRGEIADPYRGFHVIVPPEYRRLGCLPPEHFIAQLMKHLDEVYYVALLSAAELHGAAHQRPQTFQVMLAKNRRPLVCGKVRVTFIARRDLARTPVGEINTPRGRLRVATPEATALELVGYADHCGGFDNVASVLSELASTLDGKKLVVAARLCPIAWVQRLGYLLDLTQHHDLAQALAPQVARLAKVVAPLVRAKAMTGAERDARWKLAVNSTVEPDV